MVCLIDYMLCCVYQCIYTNCATIVYTFLAINLHFNVPHSTLFYSGQFYYRNIPISRYTGPLPLISDFYYDITIPARLLLQIPLFEPPRTFPGFSYHLNWLSEDKTCLYVGNSQAGPEIDEETDSVIAGNFREYIVADPSSFSEQPFRFGLFNSGICTV